MRSLPNEDDANDCIGELEESEQEFAQAAASLTAAREGLKIARALALPRTGSVQERESAALTSAEYRLALEKLVQCEFDHTLLKLKRGRLEMKFHFWRTLEASRRNA